MNRITRVWPVFVVALIWSVFLALRAFVTNEGPKEVSAVPQFHEYRPPAAEDRPSPPQRHEKKLVREKIAKENVSKETNDQVRVPSPSPVPELPATSQVPQNDPARDVPKALVVAEARKISAQASSPAPATDGPVPNVTGMSNVRPSNDQPGVVAEIHPSKPAVATDPGIESQIPMKDLPKVAARTLTGAMLTIEIQPPSGIGRDQYLQEMGAQRVNNAQLWDTQVIQRYELSGQVYVFRLADGGRVLLPPLMLARIISALEVKTKGAPLYRGRILLGPQGQISVTEAEVL